MNRLLIIEDERRIREQLTDYLRGEGFQTETASSITEGRSHPLVGIDLVILDWMLPDGQGIDLLRYWRGQEEFVPVILLTARNELLDKILGLELGANGRGCFK